MGRAQVMQAEAAGMEPSVRMNPILLKPTSDTGSQVIVNGEVLGEYDRRRTISPCKRAADPRGYGGLWLRWRRSMTSWS